MLIIGNPTPVIRIDLSLEVPGAEDRQTASAKRPALRRTGAYGCRRDHIASPYTTGLHT